MKTKEEILSEITELTVSDDMIRMQTKISYILQAMEEYAVQQVKNCFIPHVAGRGEQLKCPTCELNYDKEEIEIFRGLCESCRDRVF